MGDFLVHLIFIWMLSSPAMMPMHFSSSYIIWYMFLLDVLNSITQKSSWFPHRSVPKFPREAKFLMFWGNISPPPSMTLVCMAASYWYIIGYMFSLDILNSVSYISLWFPNRSVPNFPHSAIFWCFWETSHPPHQWPWHLSVPAVDTSLGTYSPCIFSILLPINPPGSPIILFYSFPCQRFFNLWAKHLTSSLNHHHTYVCQQLLYHYVHRPLQHSQFYLP